MVERDCENLRAYLLSNIQMNLLKFFLQKIFLNSCTRNCKTKEGTYVRSLFTFSWFYFLVF
ncbi:hypothetical protein A3Q35_16275 [Aeribacillus pallidus]|nr:hypothetical protein A3Q35_16275 [Aeribacillus pallidus]